MFRITEYSNQFECFFLNEMSNIWETSREYGLKLYTQTHWKNYQERLSEDLSHRQHLYLQNIVLFNERVIFFPLATKMSHKGQKLSKMNMRCLNIHTQREILSLKQPLEIHVSRWLSNIFRLQNYSIIKNCILEKENALK